jgi:hypothetical protein
MMSVRKVGGWNAPLDGGRDVIDDEVEAVPASRLRMSRRDRPPDGLLTTRRD